MNADFLNSSRSESHVLDHVTATSPARFLNRELSWLAFNWRVLELAQDKTWPLLERVRMVSISSSNLDEFYTVRVAGLRELAREGITKLSADGLTPAQQLELIDTDAKSLAREQQSTWNDLISELADNEIWMVHPDQLTETDKAFLDKVFLEQVFPIVSPLAVDPAHPFPFIHSGGLAIALHLETKGSKKPLRALLPIPNNADRFIELPNDHASGLRVVPLEVILLRALDVLFPSYKLVGQCMFRVLRDSDLEIEDESEDLVREFETALKRRVRGDVVRLKITKDAPANLRKLVFESLHVEESEVIEVDGILGLEDLTEICDMGPSKLRWPPYSPRVPERVKDFDQDIFAAIRQKDMLLHHPYETFDIVVNFLRQAARDPDVVAIKQTLYRTSNQSPIVEALCAAAEAGKSVTAVVELKARFDEAANIRLSRQMERAGVHVVYGFIDMKTHAKVSTIVRKEEGKLNTYTHFGTGNYHPVTANVYSDLSFFTCSNSLGKDATKLFNYISGYAEAEGLNNLSIAPSFMFNDLLKYIEAETQAALDGKPAQIWAKMNSVIEKNVIDALYRASQAGVKVDLVVRGICGVRPGVAGLSENIRVKSVVGRFLEHSRIMCFANGKEMPHKDALVFISSADWMGRNLHARVESMVRIKNKTVQAQILSQIMAANLADTRNSWVLKADGTYERDLGEQDASLFDCHRFFMENPSLSGRGKVGAKDVPELAHSND
jgi:polyphosphate kinase